jgi:hypothetical protein
MTAPPDDEDGLGRARLTNTKRIELLERDRAQQSRVITELVAAVQHGFTDEQVGQIRGAFREELADAGLRIDSPDHQDAAREDFRFLRRMRTGIDGLASKIGWVVILAALSGVIWIFTQGLQMWRGQ